MPTLSELVAAHSDLASADVEWLHLLVGDWQMLSDLSFADLVLWVRDREHDGTKMTGYDYRLPKRPVAPGETPRT